jgi:hypothetical protein
MVEGIPDDGKPDLGSSAGKEHFKETFKQSLIMAARFKKTDDEADSGKNDKMTARDRFLVFPWTVDLEKFLVLRKRADGLVMVVVREDWVAKAVRKEMTPEDAFHATFTIFLDQLPEEMNAAKFYVFLMLHVPPKDRMTMYNWFVCECYNLIEPGFTKLYGEKVASAKFPLFPPVPELRNLSVSCLNEMFSSPTLVEGGDSTGRQLPSCFRRSSVDLITGGELLLEIQQTPDGRHVAEATCIENEILKLRSDTSSAFDGVRTTTDAQEARIKVLKAAKNKERKKKAESSKLDKAVKAALDAQERKKKASN